MGKVGIFETPPQKWFKYDNDTEVLIQYIDKGKVNTILMNGAEAAKKMKAKPGILQDIFLGKAAVFGWRKIDDEAHPGFLMPDGTPIPFTDENRNRLITKNQRFSEWVYRICTDDMQFLDDEPVSDLDAADLSDIDEVLDRLSEGEPEKNG